MEQRVQWLKRKYTPTPSDGPLCKKVKFEDIRCSLTEQFPSQSMSSRMISEAIQTAFPATFTKKVGSSRATYVFGLEPIQLIQAHPSSSCTGCLTLTQQVIALQDRNRELEKEVQELRQLVYPQSLVTQIAQLAQPQHAVYHGPNNIDNFEKFSISELATEIKQHAPGVDKLLADIGVSSSCQEAEDQAKVVTVISTLVKHHSNKALGVQLLTSYMLLSRGTSRQVNL